MTNEEIEAWKAFARGDYRDHFLNFDAYNPPTQVPKLLKTYWEKEMGESSWNIDWVVVAREVRYTIERDRERSY